jgi:hypothetical protein
MIKEVGGIYWIKKQKQKTKTDTIINKLEVQISFNFFWFACYHGSSISQVIGF